MVDIVCQMSSWNLSHTGRSDGRIKIDKARRANAKKKKLENKMQNAKEKKLHASIKRKTK